MIGIKLYILHVRLNLILLDPWILQSRTVHTDSPCTLLFSLLFLCSVPNILTFSFPPFLLPRKRFPLSRSFLVARFFLVFLSCCALFPGSPLFILVPGRGKVQLRLSEIDNRTRERPTMAKHEAISLVTPMKLFLQKTSSSFFVSPSLFPFLSLSLSLFLTLHPFFLFLRVTRWSSTVRLTEIYFIDRAGNFLLYRTL